MISTPSTPHYAWVESEHPYKPASVSNYRVSFPESVQWMSVEFDPRCGTAQMEDVLQIHIRWCPFCDQLITFVTHCDKFV